MPIRIVNRAPKNVFNFLSPAIKLTQGLRIAQKMALVAIAFAIPLFVVLALLFSEMRGEVAASKQKQQAIAQIQGIQTLQAALLTHRALTHMQLSGNKQVSEAISPLRTQINKLISGNKNKNDWEKLLSAVNEMKPAASFLAHSKLIDALNEQINVIGYASKLALDSDFTTNQLAGLYLNSLPALLEKVAVMSARGAAYIDTGLFEAGEDVMLNSLQMLALHDITQISEQAETLIKDHPTYRDQLKTLQADLLQARQYFARAQNEVLASVEQSSGNAFFAGGQTVIDKLHGADSALASLVNQRLEQHISELNGKIARMFGGIVFLILFASYFLFGIYTALARDLNTLTMNIQRTAAGDLQATSGSTGKDEFAQLINAVGEMNHGLSNLVDDIRNGAEHLDGISREIHAENNDLALRTEHQAGAVQQTASSLEQLSGAIQENAGHLSQASHLINDSATSVQQGLQVMDQAIGTMQTVTSSARQISDIIGVMDGIAFQTNILALNAAVEAARAGPEGRGFAVVASEVRNLAQRSTTAAKEIKTLILASEAAIRNGNKMINAAGVSMNEIAGNVAKVSGLIQQVAHASQEQSKGINNVNEALSSIDQITQDNVLLVSQASLSTAQLEEQALALSATVSVFKTDQHAPQPSPVVQLSAHRPTPKPSQKPRQKTLAA
ncbi:MULTISPECIES: methyl-accepting chemotaxis protein [unclassified Undibacterium]|uniref:methyl-accepting chemotaxis protein n=1 Tax=unclassified Undibacterium TaxID=2630295 RepID=UPI002AC95EC6|nr:MULTISPECIES: methyl-accepting chemotaxis protein [unclassified Undibacterium]MEB0139594.1 methyl-accepting chemotaxis protein [Undibacterium sp. CCC2.1]MEB0171950.1 methyl-accepting chemotaxis protein [Undibacterium sp. CCC1.1]MEB0176263.1 methyl-accepting chemotaxis protein [Undibacterium sp. CCC3.4]MEB0213945.1 methyl-accepting chemotaxis protein [Undibacterium sp. 5I2]WPX43563.1 methyl-accepting chemotaxis protein [Undibacterium sp. CCC3.4]